MITIDMDQGGSPGQAWYWYAAQRALREAQEALDDAGANLGPLIADTEWSSDGLRSLHERLSVFRDFVAGLSAQLRTREWELEAAA